MSNRWNAPSLRVRKSQNGGSLNFSRLLLSLSLGKKMAVVLTNFSAMFHFVTCVKESENQPNDFVESRRKKKSARKAEEFLQNKYYTKVKLTPFGSRVPFES